MELGPNKITKDRKELLARLKVIMDAFNAGTADATTVIDTLNDLLRTEGIYGNMSMG